MVNKWKEIKKNNMRIRQRRQLRKRAEMLVKLKRELCQAHKLSTQEDGKPLHWWPEVEPWITIVVKKEEEWSIPLVPPIKREEDVKLK